ncbi:DsbE family thiol:disulfide interchange protein [Pseudoroseomonas wenyumeiae]|uniref:DsbE family thiol:disulfide interchange protein n=1 Tax=Teichococcus wenyumeiae TaxID=2478470 RepID=A0A3A9J7Z5_9PROT|nr:DsbE family thiol:disulfide interchange protein [Pseudoroseomonas wenyumeiae]RKK03377.1 DsbE family thiol:disulfide interchange protein [Pseudoroseomonas wenyumeiae]RMI27287.1 DsbE family thiol:disulfide interchange protein [Pseudoroseomonas wenyumeiae]
MSENTATPGRSLGRRRALMLAPLGLAVAGGAGFYAMLRGLGTGSYDPRGVPSALLGKPAPAFALPPLAESGLPALSNTDLADLPAPVLVNFWASWCVPCIVEHPQLMRLSRDGVAVFGVNYKDKAGDAAAFLTRHGNPFRRLGRDEPGRAAIDWGVYGVPETYLLDRKGIIRWRWPGPVTPEVLDQDLRPLLRRHA